jgi:ABC-type transporter Mla maintaining outer membrane lipid asymmetry ATPase subunit MlaF
MVEIGAGRGDGPPITSLTVTHDIESALAVGRRVALLEHGKIAFSGDWRAAFHSPQPLLRAFLLGHQPPDERSPS